MVTYRIREIENFIIKVGFLVNDSTHKLNGDHRIYISPHTNLLVSLPQNSEGTLAVGTAEKILNLALLDLAITNRNVDIKWIKSSPQVANYIIKQHKKIAKNPLLLIPHNLRMRNNITNDETAKKFIEKLQAEYKQKNNIINLEN